MQELLLHIAQNVSEFTNENMVVMAEETLGQSKLFDGPGKFVIPVGNADPLPTVRTLTRMIQWRSLAS
jgi:hypothetical protein